MEEPQKLSKKRVEEQSREKKKKEFDLKNLHLKFLKSICAKCKLLSNKLH